MTQDGRLNGTPQPQGDETARAAAAYAAELYRRIRGEAAKALAAGRQGALEGYVQVDGSVPTAGPGPVRPIQLYYVAWTEHPLGTRCRLDYFNRPLWELINQSLRPLCDTEHVTLGPLFLELMIPRGDRFKLEYHPVDSEFRTGSAYARVQLVVSFRREPDEEVC